MSVDSQIGLLQQDKEVAHASDDEQDRESHCGSTGSTAIQNGEDVLKADVRNIP
jgi:hypothetical protein